MPSACRFVLVCEVDALVDLGDGDFDADFRHAKDVVIGEDGRLPDLIGRAPFHDGKTDVCGFEDDVASDGGDRGVFAHFDDTIHATGRWVDDLEDDDDAGHLAVWQV